jgi:hypothetical protein
MEMIIKGRAAFLHIFNPTNFQGEGALQYKSTVILPSGDPQIADIEKVCEQVGSQQWGTKWPQVKKELVTKDKMPLKDGNQKDHLDGFAGNMFMSTSNKVRPVVVDFDKTPLVEADGRPYAGCTCNFMIDVWAQDNQYGKRINVKLKGVQFVEDGAAFGGGGTASPDAFQELPPPPNWNSPKGGGASVGLGV